MRTRTLQLGFGLGLLGLVVSAALAAGPVDTAKYLPAETGLYVGWTVTDDPNASLAVSARLQTILNAAQEQAQLAGGKLPAGFTQLLDLVKKLLVANVGVGLFDVKVTEDGQPTFGVAAVCDAGPGQAPALIQLLEQLAEQANAPVHECEVAGTTFQALRFAPGFEVLWGEKRDVFMLALGAASAEKVLACIDGQAPALATASEYAFQRKTLGIQNGAPGFSLFAAPPRVLEWVQIVADEQGGLPPVAQLLLRELGITSVKSKFLHVGGTPENMHFRAFAHVEGEFKGLLKLWDQAPLKDADLQLVPRNAHWAYVTTLDLKGLYDEAVRVVDAVDPDAAADLQGVLATASTTTGFSITDRLLPVFGGTWALYDAPSHGGLLATGTVLVATVNDPDALEGMLERVVQMVGAAVAGKAQIEVQESKHGAHLVHYVRIGGVPAPVAPAWGFVDGRWVFGLWPQSVAAAMREVDPKTRGESVLTRPDVQAARARLPKEIQSFCYADTQYLTRLVYPLMNAIQTLMASQFQTDIDLAAVPPVDEMVGQVSNMVAVTNRERGGIRMECIGTIPAAPLALGVAGASFGASIALPSLSRAREVAKRSVSVSNLRGIGQGIMVYANDNDDRFPPSLEALVEHGTISEQQLVSPRQPTGVTSYVYIAGQTAADSPRNVLVYERFQGREGTNLLYCDGHVAWEKPEAARKAIRETYRRLKREDELPPEFKD